jgi:hypothetical protein
MKMTSKQFVFWLIMYTLTLGGGAVMSAFAVAPPLTEAFFAETLPSGAHWVTTSSPEGRIDIAYDDTDSTTQLVPLSMPSPSSLTAADRHRGNYYACTTSGSLVSQGIHLDRTNAVNVIFFMYESLTETGTYTRLSSTAVAAGIGTGIVQSAALNIPMVSGKYYLLGAAWDASATYYFKSNFHPQTMPLGDTVGGYTLNSAPAPAASLVGSPSATAYQQQVTVLTNRVVRMDDTTAGSLTSTNQMDLLLNLEGYTDVSLKFRHRQSGDEVHAGDGIFLSEDNITFTRIHALDSSSTAWQDVTLDIAALALTNGIALTSQSVIRFQQVDDWDWPSDGREFDDILVYSEPDLLSDSVTSGGSSSIKKTWRGFASAKTIALKHDVTTRTGISAFSEPSLGFGYRLKDSGGIVRHSQLSSTAWNVDAMTVQADTRFPTMAIPGATALRGLNYTLHATIDPQTNVTEALENNNETTMTVMVNHYSGSLWFDNVETFVTISDWGVRVLNSPDEHWITGTGSLDGEAFAFANLKVEKTLTSLDYSLAATDATIINVPISRRDVVNRVSFWYNGGINLKHQGAYADIRVLLPAGLGISTTSATVLDPTYVFSNQKLSPTLYPTNTVTNVGTFNVAEETKPLLYDVAAITWDPTAGTFSFAKTDVVFVREQELAHMEAEAANFTNTVVQVKKSNAAYYRGVSSLETDPLVEVGLNGQALLSTQVKIDSTEMTAHFPYGVRQAWSNGSFFVISQDLVNSALSQMDSPADIDVLYASDCNEVLDCAGTVGPINIPTQPSGHTIASMDGGLRTQVSIPVGDGDLQWGTRWDNSPTHTTDSFGTGAFYMPGHFIRGDLSSFDVTENRGPSEILLSGMSTNIAVAMERPGLASYADGLADYAGLNLRVGSDGALNGDSVLGGSSPGGWPLTGRSKYYTRHSGVSGIHEAVFGQFPTPITVYGYNFDVSNFGLSYLSGTPEESRFNASVDLPQPSDITLAFEELMLDCLGELEEADLANNDTKTLAYWDADIQPLTLFFASTASSSCANAARKLCMGLTTHCANVDQTLSGILAFLPDGDLGSPADQIDGVPSRLAVPNRIELAGPADETYYFNPVAMPYYNDYSLSGDALTDRGWINFAGNLDVAFFSDLQVQFHTSASTNSAIANIYMMGGWESAAQTFFNSDPDDFDTENAGFPSASLASYGDYRSPSSDTYRTHALRTWLGVVEFDYPLEWSSASKSFKSPEEVHVDLMVMNVEHQTDYLSAENAEISFGVQYDGLPQVNLANMAFNAIDEATGMASAFGDAVGDAVRDTIDSGVSALDDTLADVPEMLFDPLFEQVLDPVIDDFYEMLNNAYIATPGSNYYSTVVTQYIHGIIGDPYGNVDHILKNLANGTGMASDIADEIDGNLEQVEALLNAFVGTITETNGVALPAALPGLLNVDGGDYDVLVDLGVGLLSVLADTLYDSLSSTIEAELNGVLSEAAPSLEAISEIMQELLVVVGDVRTSLAAAGSMLEELDAILNTTALNDPLGELSREIEQWFAALPTDGATFDEYTADEIKQMLRQKITDTFYASVPCAEVQQVVRSQLYEVDAAIQETIDSAFQQLNKALRDIASEYLNGIDDSINDMLGDLSNIMGAGQIDGYAHIRHDTLTELRLDGKFQWEVPDAMEFNAYLIIKQLDSDAAGGCGVVGEVLPEVTVGTEGFGISWLESSIKADIAAKFAFMVDAHGTVELIGLAGSFELVEGEIGFDSFGITEFYAAVALGQLENYLSANLRCSFTSYEVEGGAFFGKACSLDPFSWDPDVQSVLGDPPFTGVYVYGEGWMPIVDFGCLFQVKAGVGAGIFAFVDGPVGGKIFLGVEGEALCVVGVAGEVTLVGLKDGDDMRMTGKGRISGRVGSCPFCVKFGKTVTLTYDNGNWDADY